MNTEILKISYNNPEPELIRRAADIIRSGGTVIFPTETVYGLGANALDPEASAKIFIAKGRPQDNPLITHIWRVEQLDELCHDIPDAARKMARAFWPGPLTMCLPRRDCIPSCVTAGLDTVGIRLPSHPVARALIEAAGVPVAAPSANLSGRPSPTEFAHVYHDMYGRVDAIINCEDCYVGVESTVVEFAGGHVRVLRPGYVTPEDIQDLLGPGSVEIDQGVTHKVAPDAVVHSPGMKYRHYAPKARVRAVMGNPKDGAREILRRVRGKHGCAAIVYDEFRRYFSCPTASAGRADNYLSQAHNLFDALRILDTPDTGLIYAQCPPDRGIGLAVANRLKRAAGFDLINARGIYVAGLTGPTGAGKSTVAAALAGHGAKVIDYDSLYHELLKNDTDMLSSLKSAFPEAFCSDGFDRRTLGALVFDNPEKLKLLESIVYPTITRASEKKLEEMDKQGVKLAVLDAPTLYESGVDALCDKVICVTAPPEIRTKRIIARDTLDESYASGRVGAGKPDDYYREKGAIILENTAGEKELCLAAYKLLQNFILI